MGMTDFVRLWDAWDVVCWYVSCMELWDCLDGIAFRLWV